MKKESKKLLKIAKKNVNLEIYKGLKEIKDYRELREVSLFALVSFLEKEYFNLHNYMLHLESEGNDVFFIKNKVELIPSKIKHFKASGDEEDFNKVIRIINSVKEELKNV